MKGFVNHDISLTSDYLIYGLPAKLVNTSSSIKLKPARCNKEIDCHSNLNIYIYRYIYIYIYIYIYVYI